MLWKEICVGAWCKTEQANPRRRITPGSRNSSYQVLQMPDPKLQLSSTKLQRAMDLMPESRLPVRSIDMSFMFEIMSEEEREIRQILAKGRGERNFYTY